MNKNFDDIRPYYESEIPAAMHRIANSEYLPIMSEFIFPDKEVEDVKKLILGIQSVYEFQTKIMYPLNCMILSKSANELSYEGIDFLDSKKNYLFVSNHRDIMLDSSILQYILHINGFQTTEITFGSNLMHSQLIVDIGKSNKMFKVERGGKISDFYNNSKRLSDYIRYTISQKKESVWIAQRNGRTKDGNDITDQGIIKMFCMSGSEDIVSSVEELNIVPVAISYQFESCDILKTRELYLSQGEKKYIKQDGEDLNSILTGIKQPKGNIHISICKPIQKDELSSIVFSRSNDFYKAVATIINKRIYQSYKLFDNNYIAYDILSKKNTYSNFYSEDSKNTFIRRMKHLIEEVDGDREKLEAIFLNIYANPVKNNLNCQIDIS